MTTATPPKPRTDPLIWQELEDQARLILVEAMAERKMGYKELSTELAKLGIYESPGQLNRKVNRKKFSAAFLMACMQVLEESEDEQP